MSVALSRCLCRALSRQTAPTRVLSGEHHHAVTMSPWFAPVMTLKTSAPLSGEMKKKKKVDPKKEQAQKDRLKKRLKRLERARTELIPIEELTTATKCMSEFRQRPVQNLSFEESEGRALLLKEWSRYKQVQHLAEVKAVKLALKAQEEALQELKLESEKLYQAAMRPDPLLFPFIHEGPAYTPPKINYEAPEGKYNNITKVWTQ